MGNTRQRAFLRALILIVRRQMCRRRVAAAQAWQLAERREHEERLAARARIIAQAHAEDAPRDGTGRAA